jgi:hypothetical protein
MFGTACIMSLWALSLPVAHFISCGNFLFLGSGYFGCSGTSRLALGFGICLPLGPGSEGTSSLWDLLIFSFLIICNRFRSRLLFIYSCASPL